MQPFLNDRPATNRAEGGTLYLISTPIGNLGDITLRALQMLEEVDLIAAEDTRHSQKLLHHYNIAKPLFSFHEHNKEQKTPYVLRQLRAGKSVALISDAGTPAISDPGFHLIREVIRAEIPVTAVPGATAAIPALILSGLPVHQFVFAGFPPVKKGRRSFFEDLKDDSRTIVIYESPYRVLKTVTDIEKYLGDRNIAVARELTKKFEEILRGTVSGLAKKMAEKPLKGEFVIVIEGLNKKALKKKASDES